jgi:anti-sigma factor RsiW
MCPDRDLISAYVDGEVPSPWNERIEEHLGSCAKCSALASSYVELGTRLREELSAGELESLARLRPRVEALLGGLSAVEPETKAPRVAYSRKSLRRSISLPLPLAAAAVLLVLLLGGATALIALRPSRGTAIQTVASSEIAPRPLEAKAQPASMDELLRYLEARDGQVTLTINLPSGTTFGSVGKPVIVRSAQLQDGIPVGGRSP